MEKQHNESTDNEKFRDTDQGFNTRNQYSGSGDFSPDGQEEINNEEFKDTDQGFNALNQHSESENFSPDEEEEFEGKEGENLESSFNDDEPESPTDLQQDESGNLKSNN